MMFALQTLNEKYPYTMHTRENNVCDEICPICPICLGEMKNTLSMNVDLIVCGHTFHEECIQMWLERRKNCPVCRQSIKV